jgi:hypothetical protein
MANRTDTEAVVKLVINGKQADASLKELTDTQRKLNAELRNMKPADPGYKKMEEDCIAVTRAAMELRRQQQGLSNESKGLALSWKGIAAGIVSAGLVEKGIDLVTGSIGKMKEALGEASMNRAVLTNALGGDAKAANESLKMLLNFAAKTPEGLQQATDGFLKLVNRGIKPAREEMVNLGDVAASQKKSMDQWIEAILDATTGENERLKEFGIQAKKNGDTVAFSFKGVTKEVENTEDAIYKALLSFGQMDGVKGTMEVMAKELNGISSNIDDTWDQIFTKMGQKSEGFIYGFYNTYSKVLSWINEDLLSTETSAEKLTNKFKEQAAEVNNLEKNVNPLLDRYDELTAKGKLNKDEQTEINSILKQVANTIPGAVTQWNNLGEAMSLNTTKAREFVDIQKALLKNQNKDAISEARKELAEFKKMRDMYQAQINRGTVTVNYQGGGSEVKKLDDEGIRYTREQLIKYSELAKERELLIKGLNGDFMDEINKKPTAAPKASTARTEGVIGKEIDVLKDQMKDLDVHSKEYAIIVAKIKKLQDELSGAKGKTSAGEKTQISERKKALQEFTQLNKEYEKLELDRLDDQLSKNQKELEQEGRKYDELIAKEREFLKMKGVTPEQKKATEDKITKLEANKKTAVNDLTVRQEAEMNAKIKELRSQLSQIKEHELQKEQNTINKFYDEQEKLFAGNETKLSELRIARTKDLSDAEIREKERLEKEKQRIEAEYETIVGTKPEQKLAKIKKQYDDELIALKEKFSNELIASAEFEEAKAAIARNRQAATQNAEKEIADKQKEKDQKVKETALESAQAVADAVFQIAANNRQRETDIKLNALDKEREKELSQKNLSEKQKAAINKKFDAQEKAIKLKAWEDEKKAAIGQALINGAIAVTKALPNIPLAIATGVAAAAQLAVIVAQKPPEFATGVRNFKGGPAIVGEAGTELIEEQGKLWLAEKATLANLAPGANVYNAEETASMVNASLGEKLYTPVNYSVDYASARSAENQYRSTSTAPALPPTSPVSTSSRNDGVSTKDQLETLSRTLATFIEKQSAINELPVTLNYKLVEEKADELKAVRLSQGQR